MMFPFFLGVEKGWRAKDFHGRWLALAGVATWNVWFDWRTRPDGGA
jgi:hypothetical protein